MLNFRTAAIVLACLSAVGCAQFAGRKPLLGYTDKDHPKADTALVVCAEQSQYFCGITGVNTKSTWEKLNGGRTPWVRVLPGKQVIRLTLSNFKMINRPFLTIDPVQPRHVYEVTVATEAGVLVASWKDLGERDSYTIHMPRFPQQPKAWTAGF